jgi:hypothetical protein
MSCPLTSILLSTFWYSMTEVSCHVYKLKVSQYHTNSAIENNIELPVFP